MIFAAHIALVALGVLLGFTSQSSADSAMGLRMPALVAALLMVAQGLYGLRRDAARLADDEAIDLAERALAASALGSPQRQAEPDPLGPPSQRPSDPASPRPIDPATGEEVRAESARPTRWPDQLRLSLPFALMALALWLALAVLATSGSSGQLEWLATVSAFLLFAVGWFRLLDG